MYFSFFLTILTAFLVAFSIETHNLSDQKLQLDSVIYDVTSMAYPSSHTLLDWDEIIHSRNLNIVDLDVYVEDVNSNDRDGLVVP